MLFYFHDVIISSHFLLKLLFIFKANYKLLLRQHHHVILFFSENNKSCSSEQIIDEVTTKQILKNESFISNGTKLIQLNPQETKLRIRSGLFLVKIFNLLKCVSDI